MFKISDIIHLAISDKIIISVSKTKTWYLSY